ncbi:hypothetical protein HaLaN_07415 [Haematococcus lacustris]|uniref:Uncharacterized protein n=1 Tax=Haematococcus lacustris TaxID=44745 RepID=A0A699YRF7_HAELA|nr:hypothetical protein HaLaN_07415 [Haematococcus lacustris]
MAWYSEQSTTVRQVHGADSSAEYFPRVNPLFHSHTEALLQQQTRSGAAGGPLFCLREAEPRGSYLDLLPPGSPLLQQTVAGHRDPLRQSYQPAQHLHSQSVNNLFGAAQGTLVQQSDANAVATIHNVLSSVSKTPIPAAGKLSPSLAPGKDASSEELKTSSRHCMKRTMRKSGGSELGPRHLKRTP